MKGRIFASSVLAIAIVFFIYDLAVDALLEGEFGSAHFVIEFIVFVGVTVALVLNVRDIRRLRVRLFWEERRNLRLSGALADLSLREERTTWFAWSSSREGESGATGGLLRWFLGKVLAEPPLVSAVHGENEPMRLLRARDVQFPYESLRRYFVESRLPIHGTEHRSRVERQEPSRIGMVVPVNANERSI